MHRLLAISSEQLTAVSSVTVGPTEEFLSKHIPARFCYLLRNKDF